MGFTLTHRKNPQSTACGRSDNTGVSEAAQETHQIVASLGLLTLLMQSNEQWWLWNFSYKWSLNYLANYGTMAQFCTQLV